MEILGCIKVETVNLTVTPEGAAGDIGREIDPSPFPSKKGAVAGIICEAQCHTALQIVGTLLLD